MAEERREATSGPRQSYRALRSAHPRRPPAVPSTHPQAGLGEYPPPRGTEPWHRPTAAWLRVPWAGPRSSPLRARPGSPHGSLQLSSPKGQARSGRNVPSSFPYNLWGWSWPGCWGR